MNLADSTFVDGFPADPDRPDYAIQAIIDGELRNCQALAGTKGTMGLLYPAYFAASREARTEWLEPALRRFLWVEGRQPWDGYVRGLIGLVVSPSGSLPISEQNLLLLAEVGPRLATDTAAGHYMVEAVAASLKKHKGPLPPELIHPLRTLVNHLIGNHSHGSSTFDIAWRLWRAPENSHDGAPCYSARVRADLRAMRNSDATAWAGFLDLRKADPLSRVSPDEPYAGTLRDAVAQIGRDRFAAQWKSWIEWMGANQPAVLSAPGRDLLLGFLDACAADSPLAVDDTLYQLCAMRWAGTGNYLLTKEWLGALLVAVATRPAHKAFACAEQLVHNPDTSTFGEAHKLYNQLLAEVAGEAEPPRQREGVDGYDLRCEPELYRQQVILDLCLRDALPTPRGDGARAVQTCWHAEQMVPLLIRRQAQDDPAKFLRAVASRTGWLQRTRKPPEVVAQRQTPLGVVEFRGRDIYLHWLAAMENVQQVLLRAAPELGHDDLVAQVETDTSTKTGSATSALLAQVSAYTREHGYTLELVKAMERWQAARHGSFAALDLRRQIGWLLWLEDVAPIREEDCWSQRIRKDLRRMPPDSRQAWMAIFDNTGFTNSREPSKTWEKQAKAALAAVPDAEFRRYLRAWFEPFRAEEPLHLTVCGRDVLRNLVWCALVVKDPQVDEAVGWFASAEWRSKRDQSCSETILPTFVYVMLEASDELAYGALEVFHRKGKAPLRGKSLQLYRELCARLGRQPSAEPPAPLQAADDTLPGIVKQFVDPSKVRIENDCLVVAGVRETYEIDMKEFRIVRRSDGRPIRLELDFSQPVFSGLRSMLDSRDLDRPFRPNYFRLAICAGVLANDEINAESIVADCD
jgi:hypothetical protein